MNYRKKGSLVNAVQFTGHNGAYLREWSNGAVVETTTSEVMQITRHRVPPLSVAVGDWILRDACDHYQALPDQTFRDLYEIAT